MPNKINIKTNSLNDISMQFLRAYIIPLVSLIIILLVIFLIFIPYYGKITSDYPTLQDKAKQYDSMVIRLNTLSNSIKNKSSLDKTVSDLALILPDKPQSANIVDQFQNLIKKNNLTFTSAKAATSSSAPSNDLSGTDNHIQSTSINFSVSGNATNAKALFNDIMTMKPLANINKVNIGGTTQDSNVTITFTVSLLALDSTYLSKKVDILKGPITLNYSQDYISKL